MQFDALESGAKQPIEEIWCERRGPEATRGDSEVHGGGGCYHPRMFLRVASLLAIIVGLGGPSSAIAGSQAAQIPVVIDDDLRVFTTVAALNVAGFDVELGSQYHPVRAEIRKIAENLNPALLQKLRDYYRLHKNGRPDEEQLAKYISLAVVLTDPPNFRPIAREENLPDDAREVLGFVDLLREFFKEAAITRQWARLSAVYDQEMDRMGPVIRDAIALSDSYLRIPQGGLTTQSMRITVELAAPQNSVNVRSHQDSFFVVLGYAGTPKTEEIRHAYLHLRLNNYVTSAFSKVAKRDALMSLLVGQEGVSREYVTSFENLATESLIRAVELRIDRAPKASAEEALRGHYRTGLLLAPYFYSALEKYEAGDAPLRDEVGAIFSAVDAIAETTRFEQTFSSIPVPERQPLRAEVPPPPPRVDPVLELLRSAQVAFDIDKSRAKELFDRVLRDYDPTNGRALYGLALIEMDRANLDEALGYFSRTLQSTTADPSMKTWSYIYSGHILDFKCERQAAVENYTKALETGDNSRGAQATARRDLTTPFGGECRR